MLAFLGVMFGILVGLASGGSVHGLSVLHLRWEGAAVALFVVQALVRSELVQSYAPATSAVVWVACNAILLVLLASNLRTPGVAVLATGIALNLLAVLLNSGMPVLVEVNSNNASAALRASAGFYQALGPHSIAPAISDVLKLSLNRFDGLASAGDVALVCGCAALVSHAMDLSVPNS